MKRVTQQRVVVRDQRLLHASPSPHPWEWGAHCLAHFLSPPSSQAGLQLGSSQGPGEGRCRLAREAAALPMARRRGDSIAQHSFPLLGDPGREGQAGQIPDEL